MLGQLSDRGPDSAGVAFYRDPAPAGSSKVSLYSADPRPGLGGRRPRAGRRLRRRRPSPTCAPATRSSSSAPTRRRAQAWLRERHPELRDHERRRADRDLQGDGRCRRTSSSASGSRDIQGSHALGHTRMATESRVTTEHSHPFSTGLDLCLVHNGSLSNHNRLRRELRREGIVFQTDNDTEVAAGYLTWRLREGASARGRARGLPDRPRRLLHLRGRHGRRLRRAARPDRLQAGGDGRDRRLGRDGLRVPRDRRAARRRGRRRVGARARHACTCWERERGLHERVGGRGRRDRRPRRRRRGASSTRACTRWPATPTRPAPLARRQPERRATRSPSASTRRSRSTSRATSATTARA